MERARQGEGKGRERERVRVCLCCGSVCSNVYGGFEDRTSRVQSTLSELVIVIIIIIIITVPRKKERVRGCVELRKTVEREREKESKL